MNSSCMNSTLRVALLPIYLLITARCGLASAPPCGSLSMASITMVPIKCPTLLTDACSLVGLGANCFKQARLHCCQA